MALSVSHPVSALDHIIPRAKALGMILVSRVNTGCDTDIYFEGEKIILKSLSIKLLF